MSILGAIAPDDEAIDAAAAALSDPDKHVRAAAMWVLLGDEGPSEHGDRLVAELGGVRSAAEWFVQMHPGPAIIGSFGLTERLLPSLDEIAEHGSARKDRRTAATYGRTLRQQPPGWPLND